MTYEQWLKENEKRLREEFANSKKFLLAFVLDRSGSMRGKEADVIGGVNTLLEDQKKLNDPAKIMFTRFDTEIETFRELQELEGCPELRDDEYVPRGSTALLDAIGQTINQLDKHIKVEKPARTIVVIVTDGYENASTRFTKSVIKQMITSREKEGWGFIYLGANVDAFDEGGSLGLRACNIMGYEGTSRGTRVMYASLSSNLADMRCMNVASANSMGVNIDESGKAK